MRAPVIAIPEVEPIPSESGKHRDACQGNSKCDSPGLQQAKGSDGVGIRGIFGGFKTDLDMALRGEIVNLRRLGLLDEADQVRAIGKIAMMQKEPAVSLMRVSVEMIDAPCIERR
jgi:hypothetical protein